MLVINRLMRHAHLMLIAVLMVGSWPGIAQTPPAKLPVPAIWLEPPGPRPAPATPAPGEWPFKPWSYAKAYAFNLFPATDEVQLRILEAGKWSPHVRSEALVDREQALHVVRLVNATKGSFETSKCPFPRHAFVFFDAADTPVGSVDVCFECEDLFAWPDFEIGDDLKYGVYEEIDLDKESGPVGPKGGLWGEFRNALAAYRVLFSELKLPGTPREPASPMP